MSNDFFNHDGEGSIFTGILLLIVLIFGSFLVFQKFSNDRVYKKWAGDDVAAERIKTLEKINSEGNAKLEGGEVVQGEENVVTLSIEDAMDKMASLGKNEIRNRLIQKSVSKDGEYVEPVKQSQKNDSDANSISKNKSDNLNGDNIEASSINDPSKDLVFNEKINTELIAKGKLLFQNKTCFTCHQVDPSIPAPAGMAIKAPPFVGDFWGKDRSVHIGYQGPLQSVNFDEDYFVESVLKPMAKVAEGALAPMVLAPGLVNKEEVNALMAYVKSLSKK
tara:strand:- start:162 stop:992 length:831 start_codon:yes stop_codon:yes gene_type:complete